MFIFYKHFIFKNEKKKINILALEFIVFFISSYCYSPFSKQYLNTFYSINVQK